MSAFAPCARVSRFMREHPRPSTSLRTNEKLASSKGAFVLSEVEAPRTALVIMNLVGR
jgi:hypothetical protein